MAAPKNTTTIRLDDLMAPAPPFALASVDTPPRTLLIATRDGGARAMRLERPDPDAVEADDPDARHPA